MQGFIGLTGAILFLFALWASVFDGALKDVRTANPDYEQPNRYFDEIVEIYNASPSNEGGRAYDYWNQHVVEMCSLHMPNWEKTTRCVRVRRYCQADAPIKEQGTIFEQYDVFSDAYTACVMKDRPALGLMEYLRAARVLFRLAVAFPFLYAGEALGADEDMFFFGWLARWMQEGQ